MPVLLNSTTYLQISDSATHYVNIVYAKYVAPFYNGVHS